MLSTLREIERVGAEEAMKKLQCPYCEVWYVTIPAESEVQLDGNSRVVKIIICAKCKQGERFRRFFA